VDSEDSSDSDEDDVQLQKFTTVPKMQQQVQKKKVQRTLAPLSAADMQHLVQDEDSVLRDLESRHA
jgi:hypothetical protein